MNGPTHASNGMHTRSGLHPQPLFACLAEYDRHVPFARWDRLNLLLSRQRGDDALRFGAQTPELLADGLHYEERIARHGVIATREGSMHDLFNALIWLQHSALKRAMNTRQVADIARVGSKQRTRGQYALTHFDEAGAIVWLADADLVGAWDAHDWRTLFATRRGAWNTRIAVTVVGHALFDYALTHGEAPVAKAICVRVDREDIATRAERATIAAWPAAEQRIARAIAESRLLTDPQELRPLPLAGIPGWHIGEQSDAFYAAACFRPLRPGRRYPIPLVLAEMDSRIGDEARIRTSA